MKKIICGTLAVLSLTALLAGCNKTEEPAKVDSIAPPPEIGFVVADQFDGYRVGYVGGLTKENVITDNITNPETVKYPSVESAVEALLGDQIHGLVLPSAIASNTLSTTEGMSKLYLTFIKQELCAISLAENDRSHAVDAAITRITNDGTMDKIKMTNYGFGGDDPYTRPTDYDKVNGRVLRVGVAKNAGAPLVGKNSKGELCGINVDVAFEFAKGAHAELELIEYENDEALFAALDSSEIDIAISKFIPSEEKKISAKYRYTQPYTDVSVEILIKGGTPSIAKQAIAVSDK